MARFRQTILDAAAATGAGSQFDLGEAENFTVQVLNTGVGSVDIEVSVDGTNFSKRGSTISTDNHLIFTNESFFEIRANVQTWTSGAISVFVLAWGKDLASMPEGWVRV